jgi:5-methylcytosine-specific restriction endonuclease McrA
MLCANRCGQSVEAKKGLRGPYPGYCGDGCRKEAQTKRSAKHYLKRAKHDRKRYDTENKPSATKEYQNQKNNESYRRHKTRPDKRVGLDKGRAKANQKRWYRENKNQAAAKAKRWAEENAERIKAVTKAYESRPEVKAKHRQWEKDNPEKVKAKNMQRGRRMKSVEGHCTAEELQARIDLDGRKCYLCGCDWDALPTRDQTIDHVIPVSKGGSNWPSNLRPACRSCNSKKSGN